MDKVVAPLSRRFNLRLTLFLVVTTTAFVYGSYTVLSMTLGGGVHHTGNLDIVDLKSLGYFHFDSNNGTNNDIPSKWRNLNGKRVQLEGFMYSRTSSAPTLSNFEFVYNVAVCCFGGPPQVQERVFAHVPDGRAVPYYGYRTFVRLTGTLHAGVVRKDGVIASVYTLDVEQVEPGT